MKIRVRLWNDGKWECPTCRQRGWRVIKELQRRGIDADAWDESENCDVLLVQRATTPDALAWMAPHAGEVWLDINDDILGLHRGRMALDNRVFDMLDGVLTCSEWLTEKVARLHGNVHHWPEAVDLPYMEAQCEYRDEATPLRVAWMGGTDNLYWFDISPIKYAFEDIAGEVDLHWVVAAPAQTCRGQSNAAIAGALLPGTVEFVPWEYATIGITMASCDCAIIALEQSEWCWAKSDNKPASMMAMGLPVAVEDIRCYEKLVRHEETGLTAYQAEDWAENITRLANDADLRSQLGMRGQDVVRATRGVECITKRLLEVLT